MGNCHSASTNITVHQPSAHGQQGVLEIQNGKNNIKYYAANPVYTIHLVNNTDENYFFGVYQKFPSSPGLKSLAWQVRRVPKRGSQPSHGDVTWNLKYGINIANWDPNQSKFSGDQYQDAELGEKYQVTSDDSGFANIDPNPIGRTDPGKSCL